MGVLLFRQTFSMSSPNTAPIQVNFLGETSTFYSVIIRDNDGKFVKFIPASEVQKNQYSAIWNCTDFRGNNIKPGKYRIFFSNGIGWQLDRNFGNNGRIGLFYKDFTIDNFEKTAKISVEGKVSSVLVNSTEYRDTGDTLAEETGFVIRSGIVNINSARIKRGDKIFIAYYYPCELENPWDLAVAHDGSIYVLLRFRKLLDGGYRPGSLVKLKPDGKGVDTAFGVDGQIPNFLSSHQVILVPEENLIYIAGSEFGTYGTGAYKLDSGAYWFYIGGHKDSGRHPATTWWPTGICTGEGNKIYIGDLKVYDRTKPMLEGYLYSATVDPYIVRPGPSIEKSNTKDCFYRTGWTTGIEKMRDTGNNVVKIYDYKPLFKTIGIGFDEKRSLLFAGSRIPDGFVSVIYDDGKSLKEIAKLEDKELCGIHTVRVFNDFLYIVEDGVSYSESGYCAEETNTKAFTSKGKNRISRYKLLFGKEKLLKIVEIQ